MSRRIPRVIGAGAGMLLSVGVAASGTDPESAHRFLSSAFGVTAAEIAHLDAGQVVSRSLTATDSRELATFGVARMQITPEFFADEFANIVGFKQDEAVMQIGVFNHPPDVRDVGKLALDEGDLKSLPDCRVGNCRVQLPADAITRLRTEIHWRQPDAEERASALIREMLVAYVTDYERLGSAAAMQYADQSKAVELPREFASLVDSTPATWRYFPELRRHLLQYPISRAAGATDVVYWSKEKMGRKPVLSVTHLAIVPVGGDSPVRYAIGSKHIYGSHYLDASLGLTVLVSDTPSSTPATYVVYLNRSRVDVFGGVFGGFVRKIVTSRARGTVADQLARLQQRMNTRFAAARTSRREGNRTWSAARSLAY